jgi:hypothetical protein
MDKFLPIGTISHGTMRNEDLVPAFLETLETVDKKHARSIKRSYSKALRKLAGVNVRDYTDEQYSEDLSYLVNEDLFNALYEYTPAYCYFGSHMGDGSDYGVWIDHDYIEESIHDGFLFKFSDLSEIDDMIQQDGVIPKNVIIENDHGNVTLYTIHAEVEDGEETMKFVWTPHEVWSVV